MCRRRPPCCFSVFMVPFLCVQWIPFCMFIYLYVCILVCWNVKLYTTQSRRMYSKINSASEKKSEKHSFMQTVTNKRAFSDVKRQISFVFKGHAKMYLICFQAERQSRRKLTSFFSRHTCGNYLDVIALSCNAIIIGRQIHISRVWLLSGSLHILSFCMLFTYTCLYVQFI